MSFNQKAIYRVFQLVKILKTRDQATIPWLAVEMNMSKRTIYRYIELIGALGFNVVKGPKGQVQIKSSGKNRGFTENDMELVRQLLRKKGGASREERAILSKMKSMTNAKILDEVLGHEISTNWSIA